MPRTTKVIAALDKQEADIRASLAQEQKRLDDLLSFRRSLLNAIAPPKKKREDKRQLALPGVPPAPTA